MSRVFKAYDKVLDFSDCIGQSQWKIRYEDLRRYNGNTVSVRDSYVAPYNVIGTAEIYIEPDGVYATITIDPEKSDFYSRVISEFPQMFHTGYQCLHRGVHIESGYLQDPKIGFITLGTMGKGRIIHAGWMEVKCIAAMERRSSNDDKR